MRNFGFKSGHKRFILVAFLLAGGLSLQVVVLAQSGGGYDLSWNTIDCGGGTSSGGTYTLTFTVGQFDAYWTSGGGYEVFGGFLPGHRWAGSPFCVVDFGQFAGFSQEWLETDCNATNDWCEGADLDKLGEVDLVDLRLFVEEWLDRCPYDWPLR